MYGAAMYEKDYAPQSNLGNVDGANYVGGGGWEYSYSVENTKMFCGDTEVANLVVGNGDDKVDCIW